MSSLLLLPEDLLNDIASWLDDERDVCSMELTRKTFYMILSKPSRAGRCERRLDLRTCKYTSSLEAIRLPAHFASSPCSYAVSMAVWSGMPFCIS